MRPLDRLLEEQRAMQPYVGPRSTPEPVAAGRWPRYPLQRSPKDYDVVLQEAVR